jgi:hypothetical protein
LLAGIVLKKIKTYIKIESENDGLIVKTMWDNKSFHFLSQSDSLFFSRDVSFILNFVKDDTGKVKQIIIFDTDIWDKVE